MALKRIFTVLIILVLLCSYSIALCSFPSERGNKKKSITLFENAIDEYRSGNLDIAENLIIQSIKFDSTNINGYLLLSDISADKKKESQQITALEKVIKLDSSNYSIAYKLLANLLYSQGLYSSALPNYLKYSQINSSKDSIFIDSRIRSCLFAEESMLKNKDVKITHLDTTVNTSKNEYWPAVSTNDSLLYFTRLIDDIQAFAFERLFISRKKRDGWSEASQLAFSGEDEVNIGTMCISADEKLMFMTICGSKGGRGSCDLYYSRKNNGLWSTPVNAGSVVNGKSWEAQPSISADGRYIYFASSRPGGFGGMDIWRSEFKEMKDGSLFFQLPDNLGIAVNSAFNDFSPFIHSDGVTLYFSSEGKYGLGGSDIFMSRLNDTLWSNAINFGYPYNTKYNEDGLAISPVGASAIFSSNRNGSINNSKDLYEFKIPEEFMPEKVGYVKGYVIDNETSQRLKATIEITQLETGESKKAVSDIIDGFTTTLVANKMYAFNVNLDGYLFYSQHFDLKDELSFQQAKQLNILLEPAKEGDIITLSNIFFDFNSSILKMESFPELNQVVLFLENNSGLMIEISGHTDNIGTEEYNQKLSEERAKSIYDYLVQRVGTTRLSFKGYGATVPVDSNDTDESRAKNRRCELLVKKNQ